MNRYAWPIALAALAGVGVWFWVARDHATPPTPTPIRTPVPNPPQPEPAPYQLDDLAKRWIAAELDWEDDPGAREARDAARDLFLAALQHAGRDASVLGDVTRLLSIFDRVFPYVPHSGTGRLETHSDRFFYHVSVPESYRPDIAYPSVLVLRGRSESKKSWTDPKAYLAATWGGTASQKDTIFVLPELDPGGDYERVRWSSQESERRNEIEHLKATLGAWGEVQRTYRFDRRRCVLDCGVGTCGFGLRLATYFPGRFAGVILREPVDPKGLRLRSLTGVPILLIADGRTRPACEEIMFHLDPRQTGSVKILDAKAGGGRTDEVDTWIRRQVRPFFPTEIHLAPNHDRFHSSHWVRIVDCNLIEIEPLPLLHVVADRGTNTIRITASGVQEIWLLLNDALVDLDSEVGFQVNGKDLEKRRFSRSIRTLKESMVRAYDPTALYPALHRLVLPDG